MQGEKAFFEGKPEKKAIAASYIATQKAVDASLIAAVAKVPNLKSYLATRFTLSNSDRPHLMKF